MSLAAKAKSVAEDHELLQGAGMLLAFLVERHERKRLEDEEADRAWRETPPWQKPSLLQQVRELKPPGWFPNVLVRNQHWALYTDHMLGGHQVTEIGLDHLIDEFIRLGILVPHPNSVYFLHANRSTRGRNRKVMEDAWFVVGVMCLVKFFFAGNDKLIAHLEALADGSMREMPLVPGVYFRRKPR